MIAKILPIFVLLVATHQATVENKSVDLQKPKLPSSPDAPASAAVKELPLNGIDPNKVSCDPAGKIFLLLPHFTDCSKFFMCVHGQEVEFSCAAGGLYFDFALQTCNWAWATQCILRTRDPSEVEGSGEDDFSWLTDRADSQSGVVGILTGDAVANNVRPTSVEFPMSRYDSPLNCMIAESAATLMPYKYDCQRYWHCVNGVPKTAYCTDGLYFNTLTKQCDFEANVKCNVEQEDELKSEFILSK